MFEYDYPITGALMSFYIGSVVPGVIDDARRVIGGLNDESE